jgi:hypothetical protein
VWVLSSCVSLLGDGHRQFHHVDQCLFTILVSIAHGGYWCLVFMADMNALLSVGCGPSALWKSGLGFAVLVQTVLEVRRDRYTCMSLDCLVYGAFIINFVCLCVCGHYLVLTLVDVEMSGSTVCCSASVVDHGYSVLWKTLLVTLVFFLWGGCILCPIKMFVSFSLTFNMGDWCADQRGWGGGLHGWDVGKVLYF